MLENKISKILNIGIEGNCASGKGTIAKKVYNYLLEKNSNYSLMDQGLSYRYLTKYFFDKKIEIDNLTEKNFDDLELKFDREGKIGIKEKYHIITYENKDVRDKEISGLCAQYANNSLFKSFIIGQQAEYVRRENEKGVSFVIDGRNAVNLGKVSKTCILKPENSIGIFIDANISIRTQRRVAQYKNGCNHTEIKEEILRRDEVDMNHKVGPMPNPENVENDVEKKCGFYNLYILNNGDEPEKCVKEIIDFYEKFNNAPTKEFKIFKNS